MNVFESQGVYYISHNTKLSLTLRLDCDICVMSWEIKNDLKLFIFVFQITKKYVQRYQGYKKRLHRAVKAL